jgi:integrase
MQLKNLRNNYSKLISHLEAAGYAETYIAGFRREIQRILANADSMGWSCYSDVYRDYIEKPLSSSTLKNKRTVIGAIEQFDIHGIYPDGKVRNELIKRGLYQYLMPEFKVLIEYYCTVERGHGKKDSSIYSESHNAISFLHSMQESGIIRLNDITEDSVMSVFMRANGEKLKSSSYAKSISSVFKVCIPLNPDVCRQILLFIPAMRRTRKNIQYLTSQEVQEIRYAMDDMSNTLTLRDRAIGKLAFYTGMRSGDIAALEMSSIEWDRDVIKIVQQKTGVPLELPLTAIVGNAINDYIVAERPSVGIPGLFLSQKNPCRAMTRSGIGHVAAHIMKAANVRQLKGDRKGFHLFRHRLATALLGENVPKVVVSHVFGHTSQDSIDAYLSADFPHIKECALSIARFQVLEGVFSHE